MFSIDRSISTQEIDRLYEGRTTWSIFRFDERCTTRSIIPLMGKGRDKRRKQKGSTTAGQGASKTQRKTVKNELKQERRLDRRLQEDEEDIDALLEKFRLEDIRNTQPIIEDDCDPPSVRVHASYTPIPHDVRSIHLA